MKKTLFMCIVILLMGAFLFSSCSADADVKENSGSAASKGDSVQNVETSTQLGDDRKVVITARYTIESLEFAATAQAIEDAAVSSGGYVSSSQVTPTAEYRQGSASYVLKVPADKTNALIQTLDGIGNVINRSISTNDVTLTYTDVTSRIATLEAEETRVRALLAEATTVSEIMMIDERLTKISAELTSLKNQLAVLENQIDYSTFYVTLRDVTEYTLEEEEEGYFLRFGRSFVSSFGSFVDVLGEILIAVVYLLPYALVAGGVIVLIIFLKRRKKADKVEEEQPKNEEEPKNEGLFPQE